MGKRWVIGVVGDRDPGQESHLATEASLDHAARARGIEIDTRWLPTESLMGDDGSGALSALDGVFVAPGSPYRSLEGALAAIRFARESDLPLIGTCGGFQHAVVECAQSIAGLESAGHGEYPEFGAGAECIVVTPLECSLAGRTQSVRIHPGTLAHELYGRDEVEEPYLCTFGLDPAYRDRLEGAGLRFSGEDENREARIAELPEHRFFLATLYVPQLRSTPDAPHPLLHGFLTAVTDG